MMILLLQITCLIFMLANTVRAKGTLRIFHLTLFTATLIVFAVTLFPIIGTITR